MPGQRAPARRARILPQTEDLCGGAAVAMVLRYWGERHVYPEDFAALVDRSASGIRTDVLAAEVARRGGNRFRSRPAPASSGAWIRGHVDQGRPLWPSSRWVPDRYHYVVIVAWTGEQVIVHDPARAPFRVMPLADVRARVGGGGALGPAAPAGAHGRPCPRASPVRPCRRRAPRPRRATGTCGAL